jgi:Lipocalin-like domain
MRSLSIAVLLVLGTFVLTAAPRRERPDDTRQPVSSPLQVQGRSAQPATGAAQRLVGAWQLESRTVRRSDGTLLADPVLGERPLGRLFYDASGAMMLQMMRLGRTAAIGPSTTSPVGANPRVVLGYDAYFGTYAVDEGKATITHRVEGSLFPEDLGKDFVRGFTLDGDTLTLRFTSTADGAEVTRTLVFRRLR